MMFEQLLIIGCGNMGGAMLAGWLAAGEPPSRFAVLDPALAAVPDGVALYRDAAEVPGTHDAVLEFATEIDGIQINGVDLIRWNDGGQITDFKVMVRPLKAVNMLHQQMGAMLDRLKQGQAQQQQQQQ